MIEVEIKAPIDSFQSVEKNLYKFNAQYIRKENHYDVYFQHPSKDFAESDEALRIRRIGEEYQLTYKGPRIGSRSKTRMELSVGVDDGKTLLRILKFLEFREVTEISKERRVFQIDNIEISLDEVENLGRFIELEVKAKSSEDITSKEEVLLDLLTRLGISPDKTERRSYLELFLLERKKRDI